MSRKFGMIGSNVWDSDKFLALSSDSARLTYIYLCTTHHGNAVGVYKMPAAYLAVDRGKDRKGADEELKELADAGLIEVGNEGQIRITRWFFGPSGANSPSTGSSYAKTFMDSAQVKHSPLRARGVLEMMHSTLEKARGWNPDTTQLSQMHRDFGRLLKSMTRDHPQDTVDACKHLGYSPQDAVWNTMWDTMCHTMGDTIPHTVRTYIQGHLTPEMEIDTGHLTPERDTGEGESAGARNQRSAGPPTSTPAKGSRSGGGKVSEETKAAIASLGSSMCPECETKLGYGRCKKCAKIKT